MTPLPPESGRSEGWPTDAELEAQPSPGDGPYPRDYQTICMAKLPNGMYIERLYTFHLTRRRTEEEQIAGEIPFERGFRDGERLYREARPGEEASVSLFSEHFDLIRLVCWDDLNEVEEA